MKKTYEKPLIAVENFVLTQAISSCTLIKIGLKSSDCVLKDPHSTNQMLSLATQGWFLSGHCADDKIAVGDDHEDGICYHTSTGQTAFTS